MTLSSLKLCKAQLFSACCNLIEVCVCLVRVYDCGQLINLPLLLMITYMPVENLLKLRCNIVARRIEKCVGVTPGFTKKYSSIKLLI